MSATPADPANDNLAMHLHTSGIVDSPGDVLLKINERLFCP